MIKSMESIKKIVKSLVPERFLNVFRWQRIKKEIGGWQQAGCPSPPPHIVKQITIGEYQEAYGYSTFIETGTYMGEMVEAQKTRFKKIFSIELAIDLFNKAKKRFYKDKHVSIVQGDSGSVLSTILKTINEPVIFWLDGHFSSGVTAKGEKESPIFEELAAIFNSARYDHVILIDDARCFTGDGDYPTVAKLAEFVRRRNGQYQIEVKHDIIRFVV